MRTPKFVWSACALVVAALGAVAPACSNSGGSSFPDGDSGDTQLPGDDGGVQFGEAGGKDGGLPPGTMCDGTCTAAGGSCVAGVCTIVDNPGMLDPVQISTIKGGGTSDPQFSWMYPYDKTVFPRGLISPTLQFAGTGATYVYIHMTSPTLDYSGFYAPPTGPLRVAVSQPMWVAITNAVTGKDALKVEVTKMLGKAVTGPVAETWPIAKGSLRGTIYYETYDSAIAGGLGSVGIMQIKPGATAPTVIKSGCGNVCHTASADGSTLVAATGLLSSASYDLKKGAALLNAAGGTTFTYGGIYPDGTISMSATNYRTWLGAPSRLFDTATGNTIAAPGWDTAITNAGTPAFSPDGKKIAFIHEDKDAGHTLSMMGFDLSTKTFSGLVDLATDGASTLGWPAFTPDAKTVVYHAGSNAQFETDNGATGDLFGVDVATKKVVRLDQADGYAGSGSYLPANDPALSFAPTVLPEAVGGYFWMVFTSHRSYGNTLASQDHMDEYGKLWVAAIDIGAAPGSDPSHPAFFLDGQETNADNLRGFWVLDPCKGDGSNCTTGDECCDGYCRGADGGMMCVPPPGGCANIYEKCNVASDCCDMAAQCINGHCAIASPN